MTGLDAELRAVLRGLARRPAFAVAAMLVLGLGIGANAALFALVRTVLLRELPYRDPDRLVWVWSTRTDRDRAFFSLPDFLELRAEARTLETAVAIANWGANVAGGETPERLAGVRVSADAFEMLGARAAAGRLLRAEDDDAGAARVVVLGHSLWQRRFGGRRGVVGETLVLNGEPFLVVGVAPPELELPATRFDLVVPLRAQTDPLVTDRGSNFLRMIARLAPGATFAGAQAELAAITARQRELHPDTNAKKTAPRMVPLAQEIAGSWRETLPLLYGASGLVLLAACANLANLLLLRLRQRSGELAVRAALGASRARLAAPVLVESLVVAAAGGAMAAVLAYAGVELVRRFGPSDVPRSGELLIGGGVLVYGVALSLLIAAGLAIAARPRQGGYRALRSQPSGARDRARRSTRALVIAEVAVSLALLVGAGLLIRSLVDLQRVSPGFDARRLLVVELSFPRDAYSLPGSLARFFDLLVPRLTALPGVEAAAATSVLPMSGIVARSDFVVDGRAPAQAAETPAAQSRWVTPGYFEALGIPLRQGRALSPHDRADSRPVLAVDQALARRFLAPGDALGERLLLDFTVGARPVAEIVAVVGDVKHVGLDEEPTPTFYGPIAQAPAVLRPFLADRMVLVVRGAGDPLALAGVVRRELRGIDPEVATAGVRTAEQVLGGSLAERRWSVVLLGVFAGAALALACTGIYAVISAAVAERRHELAVRVAVGARARDLERLVLGEVVGLLARGIAVGAVLAAVLARALESELFGIGAADLPTWSAVAALLAAAGLAAAYLPARRSGRTDPIAALRDP
jgi:predicted permease